MEFGFGPGSRLKVDWPPTLEQEKEQQQVEVIQTHLPVKQNQRQWPPIQYAEGIESQ